MMNTTTTSRLTTITDIGREVWSAQRTPLSPFLREGLGALLMLEMVGANVPLGADFLTAVMERRLGGSARITTQAMAFLALATDRPGTALLMLAAALAVPPPAPDRPVRLIDLWPGLKPGMPTEAELHRIWDAQKTAGGGNAIDNTEFWK